MYDKAILENGGPLKSVRDCYKNQQMCNKAVDNYPHALEFIPECFMIQRKLSILILLQYNLFLNAIGLKKCVMKLLINLFMFFYIPDRYKTQEMCDRIISDDPFSIRYVPDQYKTQQMCDKAVDDCLAALKFVPDWFVTSKMIKILFTTLYADENIHYFHEDSSNVIYFCNGMGILNIDLNNINFDDSNYDEEDPDTIVLIRLLAWHIKFEKRKELIKKISVELMPVAWHPNRWWDF